MDNLKIFVRLICSGVVIGCLLFPHHVTAISPAICSEKTCDEISVLEQSAMEQFSNCNFTLTEAIQCTFLFRPDASIIEEEDSVFKLVLNFTTKGHCVLLTSLLFENISSKNVKASFVTSETNSRLLGLIEKLKLRIEHRIPLPLGRIFDSHNFGATLEIERETYSFLEQDNNFYQTLTYFRNCFLLVKGAVISEFVISYSDLALTTQFLMEMLNGTFVELLSITGVSIPEDIAFFTRQPLLKNLNLAGNKINNMQNDNFQQITEVTNLNFSHNNFSHVPHGINNLHNLSVLDLSKNPLADGLSLVRAIGNLTSLRTLILSKTRLGQNMSKIEPLFRCSCLRRIEKLYLDYTLLSKLPSGDIFMNMRNVIEINLAHNRMKTLPHGLVLPRKLEIFNLSTNFLETDIFLRSDGYIQHLDLSHNHISNFDKDVKLNCKVGYMDLTHNCLTYLSEASVSLMKASVHRLDLRHNPWDCENCAIVPIRRWMLETKNTDVKCRGSLRENVAYAKVSCFTTMQSTLIYSSAMVAVAALVIVISVVSYYYRFEMKYILHLLRLRRNAKREVHQDFLYDAFVSYSSADHQWVLQELQPRLERGPERYRLCLHERDFALGAFITHNIVNCMHNSRRMIVVLSPSFVNSQWCQYELEMANHQLFENGEDFLLLLELERLDRRLLPRHLRLLMDTRTYLEWPNSGKDTDVAWERLKAALGPSLCHERLSEGGRQHIAQDKARQSHPFLTPDVPLML